MSPKAPQSPKIKLCGLSRLCDIALANELKPEFVGFVFWPKSKRAIGPQKAKELKAHLDPAIQAVGVFVDEEPERVAELLEADIIDMAQLHGHEDEAYIKKLRSLSAQPLIQAFRITSPTDLTKAQKSSAEYLLLDSGRGSGKPLSWDLLANFGRPYFLAGGLDATNVSQALAQLRPFGVDVSSGIETDGLKDPRKMRAFVSTVRDPSHPLGSKEGE